MDSVGVTYMENSEWLKVILMIIQLPKYKIVRIILYLISTCLFLVLLATNYLIYINFSLTSFLQYSPFYIMEYFVVFSTFLWVSSYTLYTPVIIKFKTAHFWNLSMVSEECKKRIIRECLLTQLLYMSELFLIAIITFISLNLWAHDFEKYFPISGYVVRHYPGISPYFHTVVIGMNLVASFVVSSYWYLLYLLAYMKFQIYMLTDIWKSLKRDLRKQSSSKLHLYNEETQKRIKRFLYFYAKRHAEILEINRIVYKTAATRNALLMVFSFLAAMYPICAIISVAFSWKYKVLASIGFFYNAIATTVLFQFHEDASGELAEAIYDQDWFLWNRENRRLFVFIHTYTSTRILDLPFPSYMRANVSLIKSFVKVMYSALNFFCSVRN